MTPLRLMLDLHIHTAQTQQKAKGGTSGWRFLAAFQQTQRHTNAKKPTTITDQNFHVLVLLSFLKQGVRLSALIYRCKIEFFDMFIGTTYEKKTLTIEATVDAAPSFAPHKSNRYFAVFLGTINFGFGAKAHYWEAFGDLLCFSA